MTKQSVFNTHYHSNFIIGSLMIIQLLCSIQAFRGRHLLSVMDDGIILIYATFTLSVVFGVSYAMVYFQKQTDKKVFQLGSIATNIFIVNLLLYGYKAFGMILHPEQNTRAEIQASANNTIQTTTERLHYNRWTK